MNKSRPKQIVIRVSEEELDQVKDKVEQSGMKQQEFLLAAILDKPIRNLDGLKEVIPEMKRVGNNLNQIAKSMNEGNNIGYSQFKADIEEMSKLWQYVKQYLQEQT